MARKTKRSRAIEPATKRDIERLRREIGDGFDQLVVTLTATLKLMEKETRRRRVAR